jgi:hypothetical protein
VYLVDTTTSTSVSPVVWIIYLAVLVFYLAAEWRIFSKAGQPGWAAIIPIYSTLVFLKIVGRPWWWILLLLIPLVNIIFAIIVVNDLSKVFGHGIGFTLGLLFLSPIFIPILGFGGSQYVGPAKSGATVNRAGVRPRGGPGARLCVVRVLAL